MRSFALTSSSGHIYFPNGRGCIARLGAKSLAEVLAGFDRYVAWVKAGNGNRDDRESATAETRALIIEGYWQAVEIANFSIPMSDEGRANG